MTSEETILVRVLMTLLTLGAGFVGYAYLQQSPAAGESYDSSRGRPPYDFSREMASKFDATHSSVKELVTRIHEHTKSILDEFTDQHGGYSDAPTDNAFERLRKVAQSTSIPQEIGTATATNHDDGRSPDSSTDRNSNSTPARAKDELESSASLEALHRIAFEDDGAVRPINDEAAAVDRSSPDSTSPSKVQVAAGNLDGSSNDGKQTLVPTNSAAIPESVTSNNRPANTKIPPERPVVTTTSAPRTSSKTAVKNIGEWKIVGRTTEGRPMHSMHLGNRGTRTFVIAGMDGEDRFAVKWLEQLAESLASRPELLDNTEVVFFRAGNPDGLVHKTKENTRGVALNRNFPSRRYRPTPGIPSTAIPAGEVETRVLLDALYAFRPRRVIHLSATSARSQLFYNRLAKEMATDLESSAKVHLTPLDVELCPGSIEDFADGTLEAAVLSISLSTGSDWQKSWIDFQPQLISSIFGKFANVNEPAVNEAFDPDRTRIPNATIEPISQNPRRRGYEELAPPP